MKKLLIVDDEPEIVEFLREFFTEREFEVCTATTEEEALQKVREEKPDLMLLDLKFRGNKTTGFEILKKTKEIKPQTKVIMVTAIEDQASVQEAMKLGACNYITKPLSLEYLESDVIEKLKEVLK